MTEEELEKLKKEISFHTACKPCRNCGECERILEIAIKEKQETQAKPCDTCRL